MLRIFKDRFTLILILLGLVLLLFIVVPLLKTVLTSNPSVLFQDPDIARQVRESIWLTVYTALISTAVGLILGIPLAYILARHNFPGKKVIEGIIDVPIVVPHTAAGIALLFVFGKNFFAGRAFHAVGIDFVGTVAGIIIAMMFVSVPFLVDSVKEGFKGVDPRLEKVARTLGASPRKAFFGVSLPLVWRSILSGSVMMWARGVSEFGAVLILTYNPKVAPVLLYDLWVEWGVKYALPFAALLILLCLVVFIVLRYVAQRGEKS